MTPVADLDAVRDAFRLPGALTVVSHHHGADGLWRVRCAGRDLALKVRPLDDWTRAQAMDQAALELAAFAAGVRIPEVVPAPGSDATPYAVVGGRLLQLHHWVETLPVDAAVDAGALHRWLGETLAVLHGLVPAERDVALDGAYGVHPPGDWADWVAQSRAQHQPWAEAAQELLEVVPRVSELIRVALSDPTLPRCVTHRDVTPSNVLHTSDGPVLCDFAYAGPDVGWLEIVSTATAFEAPEVVTAYVAAGGRRGPTTTAALGRALGSSLNWTAFSMWLSLGHRDVDDAVRRAATDRVARLCRDVVARGVDPESERRAVFAALPG